MHQATTRRTAYRAAGVVLTVLATAAIALDAASVAISGPVYGFGLFVAVPFFVGFFSVAVYLRFSRRALWPCLTIAAATALAMALGFLALGWEGLLCIVAAASLVLPIVLIGALAAYLVISPAGPITPLPAAGVVLLLLFGGLAAERRVELVAPVFMVQDSLDIAASADDVWATIINLNQLRPPSDWILRSGVACPERVELRGDGVGARRVCTLSTGPMEEVITKWEPGRRLSWDVMSTPPPLREVNPISQPDPPHLHGFYKSLRGEFELDASSGNVTRVWRRTWYQHNLYPAVYWRLWCDLIARRAHQYVLGEVKALAEQPRAAETDPAPDGRRS
jgi:hypothetical protein